MVFDFAALPPEINSALIHTGPGAAPMMAAAAAWNNLAAELSTTATASQSVITQLTGDEWVGPSAAAMAAAAEPYVAWMHSTAGEVQHAAAQAAASAAAYEAAYAMTVPPPLIAANRAQLATLVATNVLGQNTPAIAATEAHYLEMWAQDAAAMYGYAAASAAAGKLAPLVSPAPAVNPAGQGAQAAAVGQAGTQSGLTGLVSALPGAVQSLASPVAAATGPAQSILDPISSLFNDSLVMNVGQAVFDTGAWNRFASIAAGVLTQQVQVPFHVAPGLEALGGAALAGNSAPTGVAGTPLSAGLGSSSLVGKLSVPTAWSAATPVQSGTTVLTGSGWSAGEDAGQVTTLASGMPAVASAGRTGYGAGPRYGVTPKVMPTRVLV
jgi:PPE-repeat protein